MVRFYTTDSTGRVLNVCLTPSEALVHFEGLRGTRNTSRIFAVDIMITNGLDVSRSASKLMLKCTLDGTSIVGEFCYAFAAGQEDSFGEMIIANGDASDFPVVRAIIHILGTSNDDAIAVYEDLVKLQRVVDTKCVQTEKGDRHRLLNEKIAKQLPGVKNIISARNQKLYRQYASPSALMLETYEYFNNSNVGNIHYYGCSHDLVNRKLHGNLNYSMNPVGNTIESNKHIESSIAF